MFLISALILGLTQAPAADASKLTLADAATLTVVDIGKIDGEPWRLCWSPDGQQLYLAAMKRNRAAMAITHHVIDTASGDIRKVEAEPDWAAKYWTWKSLQTAPGNPEFAIALDTQKKNVTATSRPMGGALARGGGTDPVATGASIDDVATNTSTNVEIISMLLHGEVIGRWENPPIVPGLTYGWGPEGTQAIAFAHQNGHLMLMDEAGRKQRIERTKDVRLPAWSEDGRQLAWAEKQDRRKFRIQVARRD